MPDWVMIKIFLFFAAYFVVSEATYNNRYKNLKKRKEAGETLTPGEESYLVWLTKKKETQNWDVHPDDFPEDNESLFGTSLEIFSINFENFYSIIFDQTSINIFLNTLFVILIFSVIISNGLNIKKNINVISVFNLVLNFFFNVFKTLIQSIRLERFYIFLFSIFFFIVFQNLGGFSLYEISFTAHAAITLFLSFIIFFNYFINYIINFNEWSYEKFLQKNLNIALIFVLFIIEFVSFFVRPFSLGVRLFANILSGHILMHIFFNAYLVAYKMFFWLSVFILIFCFFILIMELFVSCVQAYIFFILSVIYLKDVCKIHT